MHNDKTYKKHLKVKFNDAEKLIKCGDTEGYLELISNKFRVLLLEELDTLVAYHYLNGFSVEFKVFEDVNCPNAVRVVNLRATTDHDNLG